MAHLKTLLTFLLTGAFLGLATASYASPKFMEWNNSTTFSSVQTMCNLPEVVRKVTSELLHYQLVGTAVGAGIFLVLGLAFIAMRRNKDLPQSPSQPTPMG